MFDETDETCQHGGPCGGEGDEPLDLTARTRADRLMLRHIVTQTRWLVGYISAFGSIMLAVARLLF